MAQSGPVGPSFDPNNDPNSNSVAGDKFKKKMAQIEAVDKTDPDAQAKKRRPSQTREEAQEKRENALSDDASTLLSPPSFFQNPLATGSPSTTNASTYGTPTGKPSSQGPLGAPPPAVPMPSPPGVSSSEPTPETPDTSYPDTSEPNATAPTEEFDNPFSNDYMSSYFDESDFGAPFSEDNQGTPSTATNPSKQTQPTQDNKPEDPATRKIAVKAQLEAARASAKKLSMGQPTFKPSAIHNPPVAEKPTKPEPRKTIEESISLEEHALRTEKNREKPKAHDPSPSDPNSELNAMAAQVPPPLSQAPLPPPAALPASYLSPEVHALFQTMVGLVILQPLTSEGKEGTKMEISLNNPAYKNSQFYGLKIVITEYKTAPGAYNIELHGDNGQNALLSKESSKLMSAFNDNRYNLPFTINRIDVSLKDEKSDFLFKRKESVKGDAKDTHDRPQ